MRPLVTTKGTKNTKKVKAKHVSHDGHEGSQSKKHGPEGEVQELKSPADDIRDDERQAKNAPVFRQQILLRLFLRVLRALRG